MFGLLPYWMILLMLPVLYWYCRSSGDHGIEARERHGTSAAGDITVFS